MADKITIQLEQLNILIINWLAQLIQVILTAKKNPLLVKRITIFATDSAATMARKLAFADNDVGWGKMTGYYYQRVKDKLAGNL